MRRYVSLGVVMAAAIASGCGTPARSAQAQMSRDPAGSGSAASNTRVALVRPLVAKLEETSSGPAFQVRVRFNRRVPTDAQGPRLNVLVGSSGSDAPPQAFGGRDRHCYAASIGNDFGGDDPELKNVHSGSTVTVRVRIPGQAQIVEKVRLKTGSRARSAFAALGCGQR